DTSLHDSSDAPLDAHQWPFIVLPKPGQLPYYWRQLGIAVGDLGVCFYKDGKSCPVIIGDMGPDHKLGEGSMCAIGNLGLNPDPSRGGLQNVPPGVAHFIFPGSRNLLPLRRPHELPRTQDTPETIASRAWALFQAFKTNHS